MISTLRLERNPSLTQLATTKLTEAIVSGYFKAGQRLVETDLSEEFGVSRAPLREALRTLAGEGLVEIRQNRGCYVAKPSLEDMEKMVVLRALLEGAAARALVHERCDARIATLEGHHAAMTAAAAAGDRAAFLRAHWEFHHAIAAGSDNKYFLQAWMSISNTIRVYISRVTTTNVDHPTVLKNLGTFVRMFRTAEPEEAEAVVRSQIIWMMYDMIGRPIPGSAAGYVTHVIDEAGAVRVLGAAELAERLRPAGAP